MHGKNKQSSIGIEKQMYPKMRKTSDKRQRLLSSYGVMAPLTKKRTFPKKKIAK